MKQAATNKVQCKGITKEGKQCKSFRIVDETYCMYHSPLPEYIQRRHDLAVTGGNSPKRSLKLTMGNGWKARDAEDVKQLAGKFLEDVANGRIESTPTVIKVMPSMMKMFLESNKQTNDKRIEKLEGALKKLSGK